MTQLNAYLNFNVQCREAMTFYKDCLGGELNIMNVEGSPLDVPENAKDRVLHAVLVRPGITVMASDSMPGQPVTQGSNVSLSVNCESRAQADEFFTKLGAGGKITMPMENTFWGAYFGMLTDKFGIHWMFNFDEPK